MKNQSFDRELEVLKWPEEQPALKNHVGKARAPAPLIPVVIHIPHLRSELHILVFIMDVLLKTAFCHSER